MASYRPSAAHRHLLLGVLSLALLGQSTWVQAQAAWPVKPVKLIVPAAPGGPPDVYGRALAEHLGKVLGQPVVVENAPAAGGLIAAKTAARAPADGHTLLVTTAGMMTITPNAHPSAGYQAGDFQLVCQGVESALVLAANPSLGVKKFADLKAWLKANAKTASYSSYSAGSPAHFLGHQLGETLEADMTHVPYRSSPQQVTDMLGNVAPLGFAVVSAALPHVQAGKLTALAQTTAKRTAQLPDVPTVAELGLPALTTAIWFGLAAPKGVPEPVVAKLAQAHQELLATPEFRARMGAAGLNATPQVCGAEHARNVDAESRRWARVVKATGFVAE